MKLKQKRFVIPDGRLNVNTFYSDGLGTIDFQVPMILPKVYCRALFDGCRNRWKQKREAFLSARMGMDNRLYDQMQAMLQRDGVRKPCKEKQEDSLDGNS